MLERTQFFGPTLSPRSSMGSPKSRFVSSPEPHPPCTAMKWPLRIPSVLRATSRTPGPCSNTKFGPLGNCIEGFGGCHVSCKGPSPTPDLGKSFAPGACYLKSRSTSPSRDTLPNFNSGRLYSLTTPSLRSSQACFPFRVTKPEMGSLTFQQSQGCSSWLHGVCLYYARQGEIAFKYSVLIRLGSPYTANSSVAATLNPNPESLIPQP